MSEPTTLACDMTAIPDEESERHRRVAATAAPSGSRSPEVPA